MTPEVEQADDASESANEADAPVSRFRPLELPRRLTVPWLSGEIAKTAAPMPPGTFVARGQPLASTTPEQPPAPLAPCDGTVIGPGRAVVTEGLDLPAIIFEPIPLSPSANQPPPIPADSDIAQRQSLDALPRRLRELPLSGWIERLRRCGVWADRWGSPDLMGQLNECLRRPIDTVICSVLDEDPAVLIQTAVAEQWAAEVVAGTVALAGLTGAGRTWLILSDTASPQSWSALRRAAAGSDVRLIPLTNHYPQSHPTLLLHELMTRHLLPGDLPPEQGALLIDAAAAMAAGCCFLRGEPMLQVPLAVSDQLSRRVHFVTAAIGTAVRDIALQAGLPIEHVQYSAGTPLRDSRIVDQCVVYGGELTIYATPPAPDANANPDPCIRCAWCVEACPVRIQPAGLLEAAQRADPILAMEYGLAACVECGICSYVCPSHLPLLKSIRGLRRPHHHVAPQ